MSVLDLSKLERKRSEWNAQYYICYGCGIEELSLNSLINADWLNCVASNCGRLKRLKMNRIETIGITDQGVINNCNSLQILEMNSLKKIPNISNNSWLISDCSSIQEIIFPNLEEIYVTNSGYRNSSPTFRNLLRLKRLEFEKLKKLDHYFISGCPKLMYLKLGTLTTLYSNFIMTEIPDLIHFEIGDNTAISMNIRVWNPTNAFLTDTSDLVEDTSICSNNLEQFLYNFREYIVKRLAVKSSKTYIYLHATTKSYILGEDDSHYAQTWIVPGESDTYLNTLNDELTTRNWGLA